MKILLINGSPKRKASNSLRLANAFVEGFCAETEKTGAVVIEELDLASLKITPCKGCFFCWKNTPGECCIKDDMRMIIEKELEADLIVWSFPLYYFSVPGMLKNMIDRQLPMNLPFMSRDDSGYGSGSHDARYDMSGKKHVLISTCGFYSSEGNYDSVTKMFDHFLGRGGYETIFCGQGELFKVKELASRTDIYLSYVRDAGCEYARGGISDETAGRLSTLLYPREVFEEMADASWGVSRESGEKETEDQSFTKQMAALYNKGAYDGKDRVLEMHYSDLDKTYQILLGKDGSKVYTDKSLTSTTRIDTPFEVWRAISRGEINGAEALGRHMYTVTGDFSLMINWDRFFGTVDPGKEQKSSGSDGNEELKKPVMTTMLIPWITFWIAIPFGRNTGALITLAVCAFIPLIMRKHRFVIWDRLSIAAVAVLSVAVSFTENSTLLSCAGYLIFGLMWLSSCLVKEPLCSTYVKYNYGGDAAYKNPLFMKTNYILAACWGVLYVLTTFWTWFLRSSGMELWVQIVNYVVPALMGMFTVWFEKWYPAYLAGGKGRRVKGDIE
ncbi:MAG: flavodoxin family protein [Lachnospiraceae bacterium]|nr:flavodoxin family protein [Lachnospiraceae bacterium]